MDIEGTRFVDRHGRHAILRGVNLGGDSKLPYPHGGTDRPGDFSDHATVSFVGRPFPAAETDEHLGRIAGWGFNTLRLLVTWEAVEHAGPGQYDVAFIDSIARICERAADFGLVVFIDFHQDAWSRMSGGSGAPCWLFDKLGLDYRRFGTADAAHVMQYRYDYTDSRRRQEDRYPTMSWPINYKMPVNGIMWTAFFAGRTFTPDWLVDGRNVQDFLQSHYFGAVRAVAERVRELPNVLGFDSLNEPGVGWIGQPMSTRRTAPNADDRTPVHHGPAWTPLDGLMVARGLSVRVPYMRQTAQPGTVEPVQELVFNRDGVAIWQDGVIDPFEHAGAWRMADGEARVIDEDFFRLRDGRRVDVERDFLQPFFTTMAATIRAVREDWLLFAEINPHVIAGGRVFPPDMPARSVNASHWYDVALLLGKHFDRDADAKSRERLKNRYGLELAYIKSIGERLKMPTLIGEFGTPYDLDDGDSFSRWANGERGDHVWAAQADALEMMYETMDLLLLSSTQWNYSASNRNDLRIGDGWNQEDLSIFSRDQQQAGDATDGGRGIHGFCRPYVRYAQGVLKHMQYMRREQRFTATISVDAGIAAPTEIFVPKAFGLSPRISTSGVAATCEYQAERQCLLLMATDSGELQITIETSVSAGAAVVA
jgi:hypothetical protein